VMSAPAARSDDMSGAEERRGAGCNARRPAYASEPASRTTTNQVMENSVSAR